MIEMRTVGRITIVTLAGAVDVVHDATVRRELLAAVQQYKFIVIDLTGVDVLDWDDLGIVVAARRAHRLRWGTHMHLFKVVARPGPHRKMIESTHLVNILAAYRSLPEALASFPVRRALQIEPDDNAAAVAEVLLEANGFEVVRMRTPAELPAPAQPGEYDLIVTEVVFDEVPDPDLVRRLKVAWGAPVGVITSRPETGIFGAAFVHGKTGNPAQLIEQIRSALERPLREYYEAIFDLLDSPLLVVSPDNGCVRPNRAWRVLFGLLPEQQFSSVAAAVPEHCPWLAELLAGVRQVTREGGEVTIAGAHSADGRAVRVLVSGLTPQGQKPQLLLRALAAGAPAACAEDGVGREVLLSVLEDLDQARLELARINERLRAADRLKDEFVSTVSHELRTPLTAVLGSLENLLDGFLGQVNERQQKSMDVAFRNACRLARLIENLLDLPRLERGTLKIKAAPGDVRLPVQTALDDLIPLAQRSGLQLTAALPEQPLLVAIDPDRITQVVINLVDNALRFSRSLIRLELRAEAAMVRITVADDGPGVPDDERDRIFERFAVVQSRADRARTGLGLAIVRGIVDTCGGRVWVENYTADNHSGARFTVLLPRAAAESGPATATAPAGGGA
ncbi:MAG TPA: ATP-binding protein [bacterium]|nr:ATP-binding protein [bacterium]